MQRDKRIGLALAILLIGFATAFCFRPENGDMFRSPQLENTKAIDSQLAVQSNVPYLTGLDDKQENNDVEEISNPLNSEMVSSTTTEIKPDPHWEPYSFLNEEMENTDLLKNPDDFENLNSNDLKFTEKPEDRLASSPLAAPDPIGHKKPSENDNQITDSENERQDHPWKSVTESRVLEDEPLEEDLLDLEEELPVQHLTQKKKHPRFHVVKSGDMLSTISKKYLGSSARYHEIYEANRDVLKSPHDLQVGMKLKIPSSENSYSPIAGKRNKSPRSKKHSIASKPGRKTPAQKVSTHQKSNYSRSQKKSSVTAPEPQTVTMNKSDKLIPMRRKRSHQKYKRSTTHLDELLSDNPKSFKKMKKRNYKMVKKKELSDQAQE
jgi:LysM repeat protein